MRPIEKDACQELQSEQQKENEEKNRKLLVNVNESYKYEYKTHVLETYKGMASALEFQHFFRLGADLASGCRCG